MSAFRNIHSSLNPNSSHWTFPEILSNLRENREGGLIFKLIITFGKLDNPHFVMPLLYKKKR